MSEDTSTMVEEPEVPYGRQLPEHVKKSLDAIPDEQEREKLIKFLLSRTETTAFSGPVPPPNLLKGYSEVVENGAERLFVLAESQVKHRIEIEKYSLRHQIKQSERGQIFGFILALLGFVIVTFLGYNGHEIAASVLGTTTIVGLVAVFVIGKKAINKGETKN